MSEGKDNNGRRAYFSASLWTQLITPPPLPIPDWKRCRIRRLFFVSLGVPVDLDEILPAATKAKKLILPSIRKSQDDTTHRCVDGEIPRISLSELRHISRTSPQALSGFTQEEIQRHITKLENLNSQASKALQYWQSRRDAAKADKEAFEAVIENLVGYAQRMRHNTIGIASVPKRTATPPSRSQTPK